MIDMVIDSTKSLPSNQPPSTQITTLPQLLQSLPTHPPRSITNNISLVALVLIIGKKKSDTEAISDWEKYLSVSHDWILANRCPLGIFVQNLCHLVFSWSFTFVQSSWWLTVVQVAFYPTNQISISRNLE